MSLLDSYDVMQFATLVIVTTVYWKILLHLIQGKTNPYIHNICMLIHTTHWPVKWLKFSILFSRLQVTEDIAGLILQHFAVSGYISVTNAGVVCDGDLSGWYLLWRGLPRPVVPVRWAVPGWWPRGLLLAAAEWRRSSDSPTYLAL